MPDFLPDRLEAGTHNVPGIAGLLEGVRFIRRVGVDQICYHERLLARQAALGLSALPKVHVYARPDLAHQAGVVSFTAEGHDVEQIASALGQQDIAVRAGLHCAPSAHRQAGTLESGTVRVSFSHWNTMQEVEQFLEAMSRILR